MSICSICQNDSFHDGFCENCGKVYGRFGVLFLRSLSRPNLVITDKYLVFLNGESIGGLAASAALGGVIGTSIYQSSVKKKSAKAFGMIDLSGIEKVIAYLPSSKLVGPAVYFQFKNGTDLYLGVYEATSNRKNTTELINVLKSLNIETEYKECKKIDEIKAQNPIADKKNLTLTVSSSASAFITPFKGMRVLED